MNTKHKSGHHIHSQAEADFIALLAEEYERGYLASCEHDRCHKWDGQGTPCAWQYGYTCSVTPCIDIREVKKTREIWGNK